MDILDAFQKDISGTVLGFAQQNALLLLAIGGLLVIGYFVSGAHATLVLPLFDRGSRDDTANSGGDSGDGGGGD